jgi:hypothetical protein
MVTQCAQLLVMLTCRRKLVTMPAKEVKREKRREAKALTAAVLDKVTLIANVQLAPALACDVH